MARYRSPVLTRWRTPEKYLLGRRKRDGERIEKVQRFVTTLGKFHRKYQQSQPGVVYEEGLPTRPNTPVEGSEPPPPLPTPIALSYDDLPVPSSSKSTDPPTNKLRKLKAKVQRYLQRAQKMPVLTRSVSATSSNKPYLTPHTPLSANPRALINMTPLPSLFDKMIEAAKRSKRSTSVQLKAKAGGDPVALPSIPEEPEEPSSDPVEVHDIRQPSEMPTEVGDEPEPVAHQPPATSDRMDFENTPIPFSELVDHTPPPAPIAPPPAPVAPQFHEGALTNFLPPNTFHIHVGQPTLLFPTDHEPLPLPDFNSATFPHQTTYYNPPSTSTNLDSHFLPREVVPFQLPQVNEEPPQTQIPEYDTVHPQYPMLPPPSHPAALPILSASAPVQNITQPAVLPILAQSHPTYPGLNPRREEPTWFQPPPPPAPTETSSRSPMFVPQVHRRQELGDSFAWWFPPRARSPSWRTREIERQREMDQIAEPYLARLREVSRQKKAEVEAHAFAGQQKADRAKEERGKSLGDSSRETKKKKAQKELKEIGRQQRSEERRQARKDAREGRRRRKSAENVPPEGQEAWTSVPPRRKSSDRSKPYSVPHPATRSPRRSHVMPGGFDSDDLTSDQTGVVTDAFWEGLRSAVDMGFGFWMQS